MSLSNLGTCTFDDACVPLKGKSEWGMDTLTRKLTGARSLAEAFIATLVQGQIYPATSSTPYYLQTWDADDNPDVATLTLNYKGLVTGATPLPLQETEIVTVIGKTTADYSTEGVVGGNAQGRFYRKDQIWSLTGEAVGEVTNTTYGFRSRYALSAAMEFQYKAPQTTYRYITVGRRFAASFSNVGFSYPLVIERARITLSDGTVYQGREQETYFDLTPVARNIVVDFQAKPIVGSPFWECSDTIRLELQNVVL